MKVLVALPEKGFDPTEVGVPCRALLDAGATLVVASPLGNAPCRADPIMVDGSGLFLLKWSMRADANGRAAYASVLQSGVLDAPVSFASVLSADGGIESFDALLLPGGHCPDMRPYLEDVHLQEIVRLFAATWSTTQGNTQCDRTAAATTPKVIAAVCHGVVVCARSGVLAGRRVTALPQWMETLAHGLTRLWMGNYYKTYPGTSVQAEVAAVAGTYLPGPRGLARDAPTADSGVGFVVEDGPLLTARWPGDCHTFAARLVQVLRQQTCA